MATQNGAELLRRHRNQEKAAPRGSFGCYLRRLRHSRGLTVRALASRLGMDHIVLSKIELGYSKAPPLEVILACIKALGLSGGALSTLIILAGEENGSASPRFQAERTGLVREVLKDCARLIQDSSTWGTKKEGKNGT